MNYLKVILLTLLFFIISLSEIPSTFEIQSEYSPGLNRSKRYPKYKINIFRKNNIWKIYVEDGADYQNTKYMGEIPQVIIDSLYNNLIDENIYINDGFIIDASSCELKVVFQKTNNLTMNGFFSDCNIDDIKKRPDKRTSTIFQFKPYKDIPDRNIENIHKCLYNIANKYARTRIAPITDNFNKDDPYEDKISSITGDVLLMRSKTVFEEGYTIKDLKNISNTIKRYDLSKVCSSKVELFRLPNDRSVYIENNQIKIDETENIKFPIICYGYHFIISDNCKYMVFEQKINQSENIYYEYNFDSCEIIQILNYPIFIYDLAVDDNGEVYFELNGEIYKWINKRNF